MRCIWTSRIYNLTEWNDIKLFRSSNGTFSVKVANEKIKLTNAGLNLLEQFDRIHQKDFFRNIQARWIRDEQNSRCIDLFRTSTSFNVEEPPSDAFNDLMLSRSNFEEFLKLIQSIDITISFQAFEKACLLFLNGGGQYSKDSSFRSDASALEKEFNLLSNRLTAHENTLQQIAIESPFDNYTLNTTSLNQLRETTIANKTYRNNEFNQLEINFIELEARLLSLFVKTKWEIKTVADLCSQELSNIESIHQLGSALHLLSKLWNIDRQKLVIQESIFKCRGKILEQNKADEQLLNLIKNQNQKLIEIELKKQCQKINEEEFKNSEKIKEFCDEMTKKIITVTPLSSSHTAIEKLISKIDKMLDDSLIPNEHRQLFLSVYEEVKNLEAREKQFVLGQLSTMNLRLPLVVSQLKTIQKKISFLTQHQK